MRMIITITANTNPVRYVTATYPRFGGQVGVELSENKNLAMDFSTMDQANETIGKIHNPFERVFTAQKISVTQPNPIGDYLNDLK